MQAQVLEGTLSDIQKQLISLHFNPESRLRVVVTEPETPDDSEDAFLLNAPRRNGLILIPTRNRQQAITIDLVNELSED
ncbi:MAG: hypothetical protein ACLQVD_08470 [Capsulimonadaceae bacterium]